MNSQMVRIRGLKLARVTAPLLLTVHAVLLLASIRVTYITVDEAMNVAAGVSYWQTGQFFIYRVNPPLAKMLSVLPVLAAAPVTDWSAVRDVPTLRAEFEVGLEFTERNRDRIFDLICLSRLMGVAWSVLGGWLVHRWARELFGVVPGRLALVLWCFDPYVLGHAALVTTDVPAAVIGLSASYAFWRHSRKPSWRKAVLAGILLGCAALTKFTILVLYPLWVFLWWWGSGFSCGNLRYPRSWITSTGQFLLILIVSLDIINIGYAFHGTGKALGEYSFMSNLLAGETGHEVGNRFKGTWLAGIPVLLPEDYLRGMDVQRVDFEGTRSSYLEGEWRSSGWWYYYLTAMAIKEPLGTLALMAWGLASVMIRVRDDSRRPFEGLLLIAPAAAILALISCQVGYTQHSRYLIPALPYLMVNAGRLVEDAVSSKGRRVLAWTFLAVAALSSIIVYPHSLSYFNEAAGGPLHGHDHLVDSNIDWGQDLLALKGWVDSHPKNGTLGLAYFNFRIDPSLLGLVYELPPPGPGVMTANSFLDLRTVGPRPGTFAISVSFLRGQEFPIADGRGGFRIARRNEFAYLQNFRPIARAGFSIYIYQVSPKEAEAARRRLGLPP